MSRLTEALNIIDELLTRYGSSSFAPLKAIKHGDPLLARIATLRALPAGEGVVVPRDWVLDEEGHLAERINEMGDTRKVSADEAYAEVCRGLLASPAPVTADPSGNPLLWNVHCMYQQADRDMGWHGQWRDLLAAIEQHLQRVGYPNAAPANESNVDKGTAGPVASEFTESGYGDDDECWGATIDDYINSRLMGDPDPDEFALGNVFFVDHFLLRHEKWRVVSVDPIKAELVEAPSPAQASESISQSHSSKEGK